MRDADRHAIEAELAELRAQKRFRQRSLIDGPDGRVIDWCGAGGRQRLLNWGSNDYLGALRAIRHRNAASKALRRYGTGAGAARLLAGGLRLYRRFEQRLAGWLTRDDCLLTTTGYQANLAVWTSLAGRHDHLILDRLCHASSYDGARLSGARLQRFAHNDVDDLDRRLAALAEQSQRVLVGVESVYSMDGDEAPLAAIAACCERHGAWLVVDEAHAFGVLGPAGRGACAAAGVIPDVWIATASKALGAQGGLIVADQPVIDLLVNRGRSFIFSTAPTPAAIGAADAALQSLQRYGPEWTDELAASATAVRDGLRQQGWQVPAGRTPIIPVLLGADGDALTMAEALRQQGHYVPAVRPPTVPPGGARLRLTVTLAHRPADRRRLLRAFAACGPTQADMKDSKEDGHAE